MDFRTTVSADIAGRLLRSLAGLTAVALLATACGDDKTATAGGSATSAAAQPAVTGTTEEPATATTTTLPPSTTTTTAAPAPSTTTAPTAPDVDADAELAAAGLLAAEDLGEGWISNGTALVFPMGVDLAADVPTCVPYLDIVFEGGNDGVWSATSYSRNADLALSSVTVFPDEAGAVAMVDAMASDEFDACWADFNEVAVMQFAGADAVSYESVTPPDVELSGDSAALNALVGTLTFGNTEVPDSCVCSVQRVGRAVVILDAAEPVFTAAARRDVLARAVEQLDAVID